MHTKVVVFTFKSHLQFHGILTEILLSFCNAVKIFDNTFDLPQFVPLCACGVQVCIYFCFVPREKKTAIVLFFTQFSDAMPNL